eukprot:TRINITY_DN16946_c0_g1_i1.p1 TRINITY_DN16946_c0_g1~~TRINITY_DN16946_c0_g1_i1.p1  ORF type:complete len:1092 (+),score=172.53 TRINITY_DN16946_c0_g1_i1:268-3276(+)
MASPLRAGLATKRERGSPTDSPAPEKSTCDSSRLRVGSSGPLLPRSSNSWGPGQVASSSTDGFSLPEPYAVPQAGSTNDREAHVSDGTSSSQQSLERDFNVSARHGSVQQCERKGEEGSGIGESSDVDWGGTCEGSSSEDRREDSNNGSELSCDPLRGSLSSSSREAGEASLSSSSRAGSSSHGAGEASQGKVRGSVRYLYGFVFNRQRHDERLKRGGEQKSVVILTERPYSAVFQPLVQIAGPLYFDTGPRALEQIARQVALWQAPAHGSTMDLDVNSTRTVRATLPPAHTLPPSNQVPLDDFTSAMAPAAHNKSVPHGIFHEADLFGIYRGVLRQLWLLWELLLVGEPLLIIAPTPSQCSEAVAALVGLTAPLPCSMDFRPYFTIHDPDFPSLNALREGDPVPPVVLGVTNLFFLKAFKTLPHVVSVGIPPPGSPALQVARAGPTPGNGLLYPNSQVASKSSPALLQLNSGGGNKGSSSGPSTASFLNLQRFYPTGLLSRVARGRREGPLSLMGGHREAVWTNYKAVVKADTGILNRLVESPGGSPRGTACETMTVVNNEILKRHFVELTTNFLAPFGPYLRASAPASGCSPFGDPPPLPAFDAHQFLELLAARGPGKFLGKRLVQAGTWLELYRRFLEGPNFMPWFQRRRAVAEAEQHRLWRKARCQADLQRFLPGMSEGALLEAFAVVEQHVVAELQVVALQRANAVSRGVFVADPPTVQKLRGDLRAIFRALPHETQRSLLVGPQQVALLLQELPASPSSSRDSLGGGRQQGRSLPGTPVASRVTSTSPLPVRRNGVSNHWASTSPGTAAVSPPPWSPSWAGESFPLEQISDGRPSLSVSSEQTGRQVANRQWGPDVKGEKDGADRSLGTARSASGSYLRSSEVNISRTRSRSQPRIQDSPINGKPTSVSAGSTPRHAGYWDWGRVSSAPSADTDVAATGKDLLSFLSPRSQTLDAVQRQSILQQQQARGAGFGERDGGGSGSLGRGLDPNPFNPLY